MAQHPDTLDLATIVDASAIIRHLATIVKSYSTTVPTTAVVGEEDAQADDSGCRPAADEDAARLDQDAEDAGCLLWDLAAGEAAAAVALDNGGLDVIEAVLETECSKAPCNSRMVEVVVGILGNAATHAPLVGRISARSALASQVVDGVLWLEDVACLTEACRLLAAVVHSEAGSGAWSSLLECAEVLAHVLWLADNTLNQPLLERAWELLAALLRAGRRAGRAAEALAGPLLDGGLMRALTAVLCEGAVGVGHSITEGDDDLGSDVWGKAPAEGADKSAATVGACAASGDMEDGHPADADGRASTAGTTATPGPAASSRVSEKVLDAALLTLEEVMAVPGRGTMVASHPGLPAALLRLLRACDESSPLLEPLVMVMAQLKAAVLDAAVQQAAQQAVRPQAAQQEGRDIASDDSISGVQRLSDPEGSSPANARGNTWVATHTARQSAAGRTSPALELVTGWLLERLLTVVFESGQESAGAQAAWFLAAGLLASVATAAAAAAAAAATTVTMAACTSAADVGNTRAESAGPTSDLAVPCGGHTDRGMAEACGVTAAGAGDGGTGRTAAGGTAGTTGGGTVDETTSADTRTLNSVDVPRLVDVLGHMAQLRVGSECVEHAALCARNALALLDALASPLSVDARPFPAETDTDLGTGAVVGAQLKGVATTLREWSERLV